jgi:hypothetical protein
MTMTNLELIRKKLADDYKFNADTNDGDGTTSIFKLSHGNIKEDTYEVYVNGSLVTTGFDFDLERGIIEFNTPPSDGHAIYVKYDFSAFSDTEINNFLEENDNNVNKTIVDLVEMLLSDASRRFDYSTGQSDMKPNQIFKNLKEMREIYAGKIPSETRNNTVQGTIRSPYYRTTSSSPKDLSRYDQWD